jgi:Flp pilus assembly protein TadD
MSLVSAQKRSFILRLSVCVLVLLSTNCVRRRVTPDFGLPAKSDARNKAQSTRAPDSALRAVFQKQKIETFDPLTDDARVQALQTRLKRNGQDAAARIELAQVYESYNLFAEASEQYKQTFADAGLAEQAILGFGRTSQALGQVQEAIPVLQRFAKERTSANAWNQLGLLYDAVGDLSSGEKSFGEALAVNNASDHFHNNLGYNLLLQKKVDSAAVEFRKALELNPTATVTRNNLGVALARIGDLQGALEQFELASDAATAHNNLAVVLLETGRYEESRDELVKALAIRHSFAPALTNFKLVQERIRGQAQGTQSK